MQRVDPSRSVRPAASRLQEKFVDWQLPTSIHTGYPKQPRSNPGTAIRTEAFRLIKNEQAPDMPVVEIL